MSNSKIGCNDNENITNRNDSVIQVRTCWIWNVSMQIFKGLEIKTKWDDHIIEENLNIICIWLKQ